MKRFVGQCALVTGGGRGIGAAAAVALAREGATVGIMERDDGHRTGGAKTSLSTLIAAEGGDWEIPTFLGDVAQPEDAMHCVDAFVERFGKIDILVSNAGIGSGGAFFEKTADDWDRVLRVNLVGTFLVCQAAGRYMKAAKSGKIVTVSSVRGIDYLGRPPSVDYSASKAGVISFTRTLAKELAPHVNVNVVLPGHTDTEMLWSLPEEVRQGMIRGTFLGRFAKVEEIADAIVFLASPQASFITGQALSVDGGFSLKAE